jgi:predicted ArsR family transcriptional regulator
MSFVPMHGLITYAIGNLHIFHRENCAKASARASVFPVWMCKDRSMDAPSRPDDALAQPTRARLFALLADLRRPATTDELAERVERHPNGVRTHLDRLHDAGLVEREREHLTRGRPRDRWSIAPGARPGGEPPSAYADLSRWLVRALTAEKTGVRAVEATGRRIGRELARDGDPRLPAEQRLHAALVAMGFQPQRRRPAPGRLTYCLQNCPYRDVARERQPLICGLHRGITRGMLETIEPSTHLTGFVPKDPDRAGCLIELHGPLADQTPAAG